MVDGHRLNRPQLERYVISDIKINKTNNKLKLNKMAKRKTKKATKPSKITNEELDSLQNLINNINRHHLQVGQLESQKHSTLHSLATLNDELVLMREKFKSTYNTDDINIADGTINYNETN